MSEHARYQDYGGGWHQWVDTERVMLIDNVTGNPVRRGGNAILSMHEAMRLAKQSPQGPAYFVIIRLSCIESFPIEAALSRGDVQTISAHVQDTSGSGLVMQPGEGE